MALLAAAYTAGVCLSYKFDIAFLLIFILVYFIICLFLSRVKLMADKFILVLIFCIGALAAQGFSNAELRPIHKYIGRYAAVTGRICETPEIGGNIRYIVDVRRIECDGEYEAVRERMIITSKSYYPFGETVTFCGFISELPEKMNESGFDLKRHYKSKGIFTKCYADHSCIPEEKIRSYSIYSLSAATKNSISNLIDKYTVGDRGQILKAVLTGNKAYFSDDFDRLLRRTGTKRFFYPAFLHILFILAFVNLFSGIINKKKRDLMTTALLLFFAVWESAHPVMVKACLLTTVIILFKEKLGYLYFKDAVGAVVLIIGISNPLMLFNPCFVTSIAASLLISFFYKFTDGKLSRINSYYIRRVLTMGVICTIGLIPINAYYFHGITVYTIIFAVIFIPLTISIIALSFPMLLMLVLFGKAPFIAQIMTALLWAYEKLPYIIDALPFSYIALGVPSAIGIIAFYAGLYAVWHCINVKTFMSSVSAALAAGLFAAVIVSNALTMDVMEIDFVNVGQGDGAVIRISYKNTILLDGGGGTAYNEEYNPGETVYLPYLESEGINKVDAAIVSHFHKDHVQGIIAAIENLDVGDVYIPEALSDNEYGKELQLAADKNGTNVHKITEDTTLTFKSGLTLKIFVPVGTALISDDENDTSLMVRLSYGDSDCIFTGDMTKLSEHNLVKYDRVENAEILKVAHHGSKTSSSEEFIRAVSPIAAVISAGEDNMFGHPAKETLKTLNDFGISVYRTDLNGDIKIFADKKRIRKIKVYKE